MTLLYLVHWLPLMSLMSPSILSGYLIINIHSCHQIGSYPELDPWNVMHMLGFITANFLPIFVMIIAALAIFQAWILVGVGVGKLLNDLGVRNILDTKLHGLGAC